MNCSLVDELETLENIHLWHAVKVHPDQLEFIYASIYRVSIPCVKFRPAVEKLDIRRIDKVALKFKDAFPQLSDFMLRMAKQIIQDGSNTTIREVNSQSDELLKK
jgi:kinetochore protein Spc7/SPC105